VLVQILLHPHSKEISIRTAPQYPTMLVEEVLNNAL
jgi:hypothetical protein